MAELGPSIDQLVPRFILISDTNSKVITPNLSLQDATELARKIRECGGEVTIFAETDF